MSDTKQLFEILAKQIKLDSLVESNDSFIDGKLNKLEVHKNSKRWTFYFEFKDVLPFNEFLTFVKALKASFDGIAQVNFEITTTNAELREKDIKDYWNYVLNDCEVDSPMVISRISQTPPYMQDNHVFFDVSNDFMAGIIDGNLINGLQSEYTSLGFPDFKIRTNIDQNKSEAKEAALKAITAEKTKKFQAKAKEVSEQKAAKPAGNVSKVGRKIPNDQEITQMVDIVEEDRGKVVEGYVFDIDVRKLKSGRSLLILKVTDYTSSFSIKKFSNGDDDENFFNSLDKGAWIRVRGSVQEDNFSRELVIMAQDINVIKHESRQDTAEEGKKRVELHAHTNMSQMDAIPSATDLIKRASDWGQTGIAITDHRALQAFPEAYNAGKKFGIKIAYGVEVDLVDEGNPIAYNLRDQKLAGSEYVIFDTETTGLSAVYDSMIEIGATKMKDGEVIDRYDKFINPGHPLSEVTTNLTSITDEMVKDAPDEATIVG